MSELSQNSFVSFSTLLSALSNNSVKKVKDSKISIHGTIISSKEFDKLYLKDIENLFLKYEKNISPDFAPTSELYTALNIFSSPVLKNTSVPKTISSFYKKMKKAIEVPKNKKVFEKSLTHYVKNTPEAPVFMLANMDLELKQNNDSNIYKTLMPTSSTLFEGYGTKFDGNDILNFANQGFIDEDLPLKMLIYKSLYAQDENSDTYIEPVSCEALLDFYSPEKNPNRMHNILKSGKITPEFSELHEEMLENVSITDKKNYINDLIAESKSNAETSEEYSQEVLEYNNHKIIPNSFLENNISSKFIIKAYKEKNIPISRVVDIYQEAPEYFSSIENILTPDAIISAHEKDELNDDSLMLVPKQNRIDYLQNSTSKLSTIMYLFLHCNGFTIKELKQLLVKNKVSEPLDFYIDKGSSTHKIKELYENFLIDNQCMKNLKNSGILSETDLLKYNLLIDKDKIYQSITENKNISILGSADTVPFSTTGYFIEKASNKNLLNTLDASYSILGAPLEHELPTINHVDEHKKSGFLNDYKVLPLPNINLVAFVPPENTSSTYLMPYQETAYILHNNALPYNFLENENIVEIRHSKRLDEDIFKTAYEFEEAKPYLNSLRLF